MQIVMNRMLAALNRWRSRPCPMSQLSRKPRRGGRRSVQRGLGLVGVLLLSSPECFSQENPSVERHEDTPRAASVLAASRLLIVLPEDASEMAPFVELSLEPLLDELRAEQLQSRLATAPEASPPSADACGEEAPSFELLLERAEIAWKFQRMDRLESLLRQLEESLRCTPPLRTEVLARYVLADGLLQAARGKASSRLEEALLLQPSLPMPRDLDGPVAQVWKRAALSVSTSPRRQVTFELTEAAPFVLSVDGRPAEAGMYPVGRHFLQWLAPDGRALAGQWAELTPGTEAEIWPPSGLRLPGRAEVLEALKQAVRAGTLSPELGNGLLTLPWPWKARRLELKGSTVTDKGSKLQGWLLTENGLQPLPLPPVPASRPKPPSRVAERATLVLGTLSLSSLAVGMLGYYLNQGDFSPEDQLLGYKLAIPAYWVSGVTGAGAVVAGGFWLAARPAPEAVAGKPPTLLLGWSRRW